MNPNQFCMVSPWMENGNVLGYTRKNPEVNRLRLASLIDQWINVEFDHRCLVADRCGKRPEVPSPGGFSAWEHSGGMSCRYDSHGDTLLKTLQVKHSNK